MFNSVRATGPSALSILDLNGRCACVKEWSVVSAVVYWPNSCIADLFYLSIGRADFSAGVLHRGTE